MSATPLTSDHACKAFSKQELRNAYTKGHLISKTFVNELGHVGYVYQGEAYFLGYVPEDAAGFIFEEI